MATGPLSDTEKQRIRDLHSQGATRNDIARDLGRSSATISKWCGRLGLGFDRKTTAAATAAKVEDAKAKRAAIMQGLLDDAQKLRGQLFAPAVIFSFGGKDNSYEERKVPEPPARDKRDLMASIVQAVNASLRLDEHDRGSDVDDAKAMVDELYEALTGAWEQYHREHPEQTPGGPS
ncbi:helix-turn-helix domain-containing protein [Saccharothrix sp. HUAS TT1]|uniref:helix-turn-helix domain-containing protein n=1 Tax=unclassified Saccharothrix TaxID=2593673 RepID=UPI00345C0F3C